MRDRATHDADVSLVTLLDDNIIISVKQTTAMLCRVLLVVDDV